ncbi:hypothetical protein [Bacillus sinesaloumensis]|uniref:hypothetical protein n=1 Tax=Litchfieldia sinesaloumensis TaxID=1926280 RepID=UPI0009884CAF|nr:hypothetical protein [Bacillus sinesaloumensis]
MNPFIVLFLIGLAVAADYFWFDVDKKRWGWMKNWSTFTKGLFVSGFVIVSILIYIGLSMTFFN